MLTNKFGLFFFRKAFSNNFTYLSKRFATPKYVKNLEQLKQAKISDLRREIIEIYDGKKNAFNWNEFTKELIANRKLHKENMEVMLMSALERNEEVEFDEYLIRSFIKYLDSVPHIKTNNFISSRFCKFLSDFAELIDDKNNKEIRQISDMMVQKYIDNTILVPIVKDCIVSLAKTSRDNCLHAIDLLSKVESIKQYSHSMNNMISSAFKYNLNQQAFLLASSSSNLQLNEENVKSFLNVLNNEEDKNKILETFQLFRENYTVFNSEQSDTLKSIMSKCNFRCVDADITLEGSCYKCGDTLSGLNDDEFEKMRNIFRSTFFAKEKSLFPLRIESENKLKTFELFLTSKSSMEPFDLVIDGLNTGFRAKGKYIIAKKQTVKNLVRIVPWQDADKLLVESIKKIESYQRFQNVLLIGRKHMAEWPQLMALLRSKINYIKPYFFSNDTFDDNFILYTAMQHPKTLVLSFDFYRDFRENMTKENSGHLFERWLNSHQIIVENSYFHFPKQYDIRVNISDNYIHIPIKSKENEEEYEWLCCQKNR